MRRRRKRRKRMTWTSLEAMTASGATTAAWAVTAAPVWKNLVMMRWQIGNWEIFHSPLCTSHPRAGLQKTVALSQVVPILVCVMEGMRAGGKQRVCDFLLSVLWEQNWAETAGSGLHGGPAMCSGDCLGLDLSLVKHRPC